MTMDATTVFIFFFDFQEHISVHIQFFNEISSNLEYSVILRHNSNVNLHCQPDWT